MWNKTWYITLGVLVSACLIVVVLIVVISGNRDREDDSVAVERDTEAAKPNRSKPRVEPDRPPPKSDQQTTPGGTGLSGLQLSRPNELVHLKDSRALCDFSKPFTMEMLLVPNPRSHWHYFFGNLAHGSLHPDVSQHVAGFAVTAYRDPRRPKVFTFTVQQLTGKNTVIDASGPLHLALTNDGKQVSLFVQGKPLIQTNADYRHSAFHSSPLGLSLGSNEYVRGDIGSGLNGTLKYFRVLNECLYQSEFEPPQRVQATESTTALLVFDQSPAAVHQVKDSSNRGRDGIVGGGQWVGIKTPAAPSIADDEATPVSPGSTVDLLTMVEPVKHIVRGRAHTFDRRLFTDSAGGNAHLVLPVTPPEYYELEVQATRLEGNHCLYFGLPVKGQLCRMSFDDSPGQGHVTGIGVVGQKRLSSPESPGRYRGQLLKTGKTTTLTMTVGPSQIVASANGQAVFTWKGDPTSLGLLDAYKLPMASAMFIGSWNSRYEITKCELRALDPSTAASRLRERELAARKAVVAIVSPDKRAPAHFDSVSRAVADDDAIHWINQANKNPLTIDPRYDACFAVDHLRRAALAKQLDVDLLVAYRPSPNRNYILELVAVEPTHGWAVRREFHQFTRNLQRDSTTIVDMARRSVDQLSGAKLAHVYVRPFGSTDLALPDRHLTQAATQLLRQLLYDASGVHCVEDAMDDDLRRSFYEDEAPYFEIRGEALRADDNEFVVRIRLFDQEREIGGTSARGGNEVQLARSLRAVLADLLTSIAPSAQLAPASNDTFAVNRMIYRAMADSNPFEAMAWIDGACLLDPDLTAARYFGMVTGMHLAQHSNRKAVGLYRALAHVEHFQRTLDPKRFHVPAYDREIGEKLRDLASRELVDPQIAAADRKRLQQLQYEVLERMIPRLDAQGRDSSMYQAWLAEAPRPPKDNPATSRREYRLWTHADGRKASLTLLEVVDNQAKLQDRSGNLFVFPTTQLSDEDQAYIRQWLEQRERK